MTVTRSKRAIVAPTPSHQPSSKKLRSAQDEAEHPLDAPNEETPRCTKHLMKSEPQSRLQDGHDMKFSIDDLLAEKDGVAFWDGIRNFEAKNCMMRMKKGDLAFFYHSNSKKNEPGIVGILEIVREAYPDHTQFNPTDPHYDAKSNEREPRWFMVDVCLIRRFYEPVTLEEIKATAELQEMELINRGKVSVQDVTDAEWDVILRLAESHESK